MGCGEKRIVFMYYIILTKNPYAAKCVQHNKNIALFHTADHKAKGSINKAIQYDTKYVVQLVNILENVNNTSSGNCFSFHRKHC